MRYEKILNLALDVIKENIVETKFGLLFTACPQKIDNYFSLWTRDSMVTLLAVTDIEDQDIRQACWDSWRMIEKYQTKLGRLTAYIELNDPDHPKAIYGGWGKIETLDSQMWYVLGAEKLFKVTNNPELISKQRLSSYVDAMHLLDYRTMSSDPNQLVEWPVSAGMDDQMHRRHHVTSLECLRIMALESLGRLMKSAGKDRIANKYFTQADNIKKVVNKYLWLTKENVKYQMAHYSPQNGSGYYSAYYDEMIEFINQFEPQYYQSYLAPFIISPHHVSRFDSYGNLLAIISGVANKNRDQLILNYISENKVDQPFPLKIMDKAIKSGDEDYHKFLDTGRNKTDNYHNGAIWPHVSAMYVKTLIMDNQINQAKKATDQIINMCLQPGDKNEYSFSEYYESINGKPGNDANEHQCWSAAGVIAAINYIKDL